MRRPNTISRATTFSIGELSERTGVRIETIRYYEQIGLLPAPPRSSGNHRIYEDDHRRTLSFVRRARGLGFSPDEIRTLLVLARNDGLACGKVQALTELHLADIRHKIRDMTRLERLLSGLAEDCRAGAAPSCPILAEMGREGDFV